MCSCNSVEYLIDETRPPVCQSFLCAWRLDLWLGSSDYRPDRLERIL
jgi:hypothetical protein